MNKPKEQEKIENRKHLGEVVSLLRFIGFDLFALQKEAVAKIIKKAIDSVEKHGGIVQLYRKNIDSGNGSVIPYKGIRFLYSLFGITDAMWEKRNEELDQEIIPKP